MRSGGAAALPFHGASSARRIFPVLFLAAASRGTTGRDWRRHADTIPRPRARRHFHNIQMYKSAGPIPRPLQEDEGDGGSARGGKKIHRYERDVGGRREKERRCEKGARKREKNATKSAKRKEEMSGERERARSERTRGCASEGGREDRRSTKWRRGIGRCGAGTRWYAMGALGVAMPRYPRLRRGLRAQLGAVCHAVVLPADIFIGGRATCNRLRGIRTERCFAHLYPRFAARPIQRQPSLPGSRSIALLSSSPLLFLSVALTFLSARVRPSLLFPPCARFPSHRRPLSRFAMQCR